VSYLQKRFKTDRRLQNVGTLEKTKVKLRNYLENLRKKKTGSLQLATGNDQAEFEATHFLKIPDDWEARSDFHSADELAAALGCEGDTQLFLEISPEIKKAALEALGEHRFRKEDEDALAATTITVSPATLYTLLEFIKNAPPGSRCGHVDGTFGLVFDGSAWVIFGCNDVRYRDSQYEVTSSLRIFSFLKTPGECKIPFIVMLIPLKFASRDLFALPFELDYVSLLSTG